MIPADRKILISGASGLLGQALLDALQIRQWQITKLLRKQASSGNVAGAVQTLGWNPAATPAFSSLTALEDHTAAIHLSGANIAGHRWTAAYRRELTESRLQSTGRLCEALAQLKNPPKTLLMASAVGFYGNRGSELLQEDSAPGSGFLAELCQQWELASAPASRAGIRVVHLRLGVILAPRGGALGRMLPLFRLGLGGRLGSGQQWMAWIGLDDAMRGFLFALDHPELNGPVNLVAPGSVTNADFTQTLGRILHRPALLPAPALALRLALGQMADEALLASSHVSPTRLLNSGFIFLQPTLESALLAALHPTNSELVALS